MADRDETRRGRSKKPWAQLELPLPASTPAEQPAEPRRASPETVRPGLRVIKGEGKKRDETLQSRDDVARILVAAAADMLLRRISDLRAEEIEKKVGKVLNLFDRCDREPALLPVLRRQLDDLEALWRESELVRKRR